MKRIAAVLFALLVFGSAMARADVGPENEPNDYRMDVTKSHGPGHIIWSRITFPARNGGDGWDPRGRVGYKCNSVERVQNGQVVGRIVEETYGDAAFNSADGAGPLYSYMDSPGYGTGSDGPCSAIGTGGEDPDLGLNNGDIVPATAAEHARSTSFCEPSTAHGHVITMHGPNGEAIDTPLIPHREFNLMQGDPTFVGANESCWFRGDEPGEIMLWYRNPDTLDYGIVARLSCAGLAAGWSCTDTVIRVPNVLGFSPTSGQVGDSVLIQGTGFTDALSVGFNGTAASYVVNSDTNITATVPSGATDGPITVVNTGGSSTSSSSFDVTASSPVPTITGFSPTSGSAGTNVTITGTNFTDVVSVKFNGSASGFSVDSSTQITAIVPSGATDGTIAVETTNGTATSASSFDVTSSCTPQTVNGSVSSTATSGATQGTGVAWTNPGNVTSNDGAYAKAELSLSNGTTSAELLSSFGLSVPDDATVTGVTVEVERSKFNSGNQTDSVVSLALNGSVVGNNKADTATQWPATDTVVTYGSSTDTWGLSLTQAQAEALQLVIRTARVNGTSKAQVDYTRLTVYYTQEVCV